MLEVLQGVKSVRISENFSEFASRFALGIGAEDVASASIEKNAVICIALITRPMKLW